MGKKRGKKMCQADPKISLTDVQFKSLLRFEHCCPPFRVKQIGDMSILSKNMLRTLARSWLARV